MLGTLLGMNKGVTSPGSVDISASHAEISKNSNEGEGGLVHSSRAPCASRSLPCAYPNLEEESAITCSFDKCNELYVGGSGFLTLGTLISDRTKPVWLKLMSDHYADQPAEEQTLSL